MSEHMKLLKLTGRVDSANAAEVEKDLSKQLGDETDCGVEIDAQGLDYISSAGLRVLLRLKKRISDFTVRNVSPVVYQIFETTGFTEMMKVEKAYRTVSVEGCEEIGRGANGIIYRTDRDTVVKVYNDRNALEEIRQEREMAKLALILGIPTAISYDIVRVGKCYGSVFELLNAVSFSDILTNHPEKLDWCVKESIGMLKLIHSTEAPSGKVPSAAKRTLKWLGRIGDHLPDETTAKIRSLIEALPEDDHLIHGDFHTKNLMLHNDEVLLIDMETLAAGHPIFDLATMYCAYIGFSELDSDNIKKFQGYDNSVAAEFWRKSIAEYLGTDDEAKLRDLEEKSSLVGYIRMIDFTVRHIGLEHERDRANVKYWADRLNTLVGHVSSLEF